jgi:molybdate transport system substrate-binding protein
VWQYLTVAGVLAVTGAWGEVTVQAAELIVLTGMGSESGVRTLAAGFEQASGHKVTVSFETGPSLAQKLESNAPADLFTGGPEGVEDLIKKGKVVAGTNTPFGLAGLGLSVKIGALRPDISTVEAFKAALLNAKSIGYSRGCSGTYAAEGIAKLGVADAIKSKVTLTGGGPVAEYVARGEVELGIQQTNVMVGVPGADYVGPLPGFLNKPCPFNVGLMAVSKNPDAARAMIKFMTLPDATPLLQKAFMEPVRQGS